MDFLTLAMICAPFVNPETLSAIVKTESNYQRFAIGINSDERLQWQPSNKEEALVTARWLIDNGYNIDVGLGQLNSKNFQKLGLAVEDALDPCTNLKASGEIFRGNLQQASKHLKGDDALKAALSAYNTGTFNKGLENGYVQKVLSNMEYKSSDGTEIPSQIAPIPLVRKGQTHASHPQAALSTKSTQNTKSSDSVYGERAAAEEDDIYVYSRTDENMNVYQ